jgi:hypothetical protein
MKSDWMKLVPVGIKIGETEILFDKINLCQLHKRQLIDFPGFYLFPCTGIMYAYYDGESWFTLKDYDQFLFDPEKELPEEWVGDLIVCHS